MENMNSSDLNRWIGVQIYRERIARKISQAALAEAADVSRVFISNLENGNYGAKIDTYYRIACAFDISLCELFRGSEVTAAAEDMLFLFGDCSHKEIRALMEILRVSKTQIALLRK
jgi:transcriptional regulator with XRE-family HTH domain